MRGIIPENTPIKAQAIKAREFHAHLEACEQCRNNPFRLCATGAQILTTPLVQGAKPIEISGTLNGWSRERAIEFGRMILTRVSVEDYLASLEVRLGEAITGRDATVPELVATISRLLDVLEGDE